MLPCLPQTAHFPFSLWFRKESLRLIPPMSAFSVSSRITRGFDLFLGVIILLL